MLTYLVQEVRSAGGVCAEPYPSSTPGCTGEGYILILVISSAFVATVHCLYLPL
jgi:hypothetical protein